MQFPTPVFLGADLNCYQLARLFHETWGVKSHAFGRYPLAETSHSNILTMHYDGDLWQTAHLADVLLAFANTHAPCLLFGCTDQYVREIVALRACLSAHYLIPYGDSAFLARATDKAVSGTCFAAAGVPVPRTYVIDRALPDAPLVFPMVLKPADSADYYLHPFPDMRKAYFVKSKEEAARICGKIRAAGCQTSLLLQDYIPGDDTAMFVANGYTDAQGNLRQIAVGQVLCQAHTPNGIGNPCAILTKPNPELESLAARAAEALGARGLWNIDIRYDARDDTYRVLECNPRQGRSAYSTQTAGIHPLRSVVEDLVFHMPYTETRTPTDCGFWHSLPTRAVLAKNKAFRHVIRTCIRAKKEADTLRYKHDLQRNPMRRFSLLGHRAKHIIKFHVYDKDRSAVL